MGCLVSEFVARVDVLLETLSPTTCHLTYGEMENRVACGRFLFVVACIAMVPFHFKACCYVTGLYA